MLVTPVPMSLIGAALMTRPPSVDPISPDIDLGYGDDFETPGSLNGRAGWTLTDPTKSWQAIDGAAKMTTMFAAANSAIFAPIADFGADVTYSLGYDFGASEEPFGSGRVGWIVWWKDADNYVKLVPEPEIGTGRLSVTAVIGGSETSLDRFSNVGWARDDAGDILFEIRDAKLRVMLNGRWLKQTGALTLPFDELDLSAVAAGNRGGAVALNGATFAYTAADYIWANSLKISVDQLPGFVARGGAASTGAIIAIGGSYSGTPTRWIYRVLDTAGAVKLDWTDLADATASAGTWAANAFVATPAPFEAAPLRIIECGYIDANGKSYIARSTAVAVGAHILYYGQSNAVGRKGGTWSGTAVALAHSDFGGTPPMWASPEWPLYDKAVCYELAYRLSAILGIPVGCSATGQPGADMSYMLPTGSFWPTFTGVIDNRGKPEAILWDQGEGDADGASAPTGYASTWLGQLAPGIRDYVGDPALPILPIIIGRYAGTLSGAPGLEDGSYRNTLHRQVLEIEADGFPIMSWAGGREHSDAYHYTSAGYIEGCRREALSVARFVYGETDIPDGAGPRVTGGTRSGATVTLDLDMRGWTGLSGSALTGYEVSTDGGTTWTAPAGATTAGGKIVLTLASAAPVLVRSYYGWQYDDSSLAMGTYSGPAGTIDPVPVFPIIVPIAVA